ncbi:PKD domain-containing protein [Geodermatophilus tzadiensis]|uniref:PKD domain-containing protein n=1 Tax=Geodermatophilus tzadiensis TaxID=1137988 RepID=A0A2T0TUG2_9ACTN|nr:PKD domain-containing protein [Geodermatophilus tzadiensis]PRY49342.1 PKD domain-containing protein [Geodermatophilus tzadiensis]
MPARVATTLRKALAGVLGLLLVAGVLALAVPTAARADSAPLDPADPATPTTVTADPLPTVQVDGIVWSQVVVGNTVYAAGKFDNARPAGAAPGTQLTPRGNLLAYDIRTGELVPSFAPSLNAQALVVAASPDGSRVYVGGDFTTADGQTRQRVAAYSTATGRLVAEFRPPVAGQVRAIAATDTTVYLGGDISAVGSAGRNRLAAVSAATGALLPWAPQPGTGSTAGNVLPNDDPRNRETSNAVMALVVAGPDGQVVAAGRFDGLNGVPATGVGALDGVTGATRPFEIGRLVTNQGVNSGIWSLSTDGTNVYGTGYDFYGPGNLEGSFAVTADGGTVRWINDCRGDSFAAVAVNGAVYMAGHPHECSQIGGYPEQNPRVHQFGTALSLAATGKVGPYGLRNNNLVGRPAPSLLAWFPTFSPGAVSGASQATWHVTGTSRYVVYGGEFPTVNGSTQQGLVRFAARDLAPNAVAPRAVGTFAPTVTAVSGAVRVSWPAAVDRDNEHLTYRVHRDSDTAAPVCQVTRPSTFWRAPTYACLDRGAAAGSHRYLVTATDPAGNRLASAWVTAEVPAGATSSPRPYAQQVAADGAVGHWSLGEAAGATAFDAAGAQDMTVNAGVTRGQAGAIGGDRDTAVATNGSSTGFLATRTAVPSPDVFSVEAWFRTTSTRGGKIVGFGNAATGSSTAYDRHVFLDPMGRVYFGVHNGAAAEVRSDTAYNDGRWHHVVGSLSPRGLEMYVDGVRIGIRGDVTTATSYAGYWRVGGDTSWWVGSDWFNGQVDEVALYPQALSAQQIGTHLTLGRGANLAPTAAVDVAVSDLTATVNGTSSADVDGTVAGYAWEFGDGVTGTGPTASHTYAAAGTYTVRLTVTDDDGATGTTTRVVTVTQAPAGAGSVASDSFERSVVSGWGSADRGGAWTVGGTTAVTGGAGQLTAAAGRNASALLGGVSRSDVAVQAALTLPQTATGGGTYLSVATRRVGTTDYRVLLRYRGDGQAEVMLARHVDGVETVLTGTVLPGGYTPGTSLTVRFETEGTGTTTLRTKVWATGTAEPAAWLLTRTDATAALQRPGALYLYEYVSGSATRTSAVRVDDLRAEPAGTVVPQPPANTAPTAAFTAATTGLAVAVDGTSSADADGTVAGYAWEFGDGATGTGATASHTYAAAGTYTVRLTVTDDDGATGTTTRGVTVTAPAPQPQPQPGDTAVAADSFERSVVSGWGSADRGGAWTAGGTTAVTGGAGQLTAAAGRNASALLGGLSQADAAVQAELVLPQVATGGGTYVSVAARRVGTSDYRVLLRFRGDGQAEVMLARYVDGVETILTGTVLPGGYTPGGSLTVRFETEGTGTTTLRAKLWATGTAEPAAWLLTRTDATAALQRPGALYLYEYVSGSATRTSTVSVDDLWVGPAGTVPGVPAGPGGPEQPANQAPTAAFTAAATGLAVAVDAAGSADADGRVVAQAWEFGDGATGTGPTASHTYAAAGTYTVRLTVTDDDGATGTTTRAVTVTAPAPQPQPEPQPEPQPQPGDQALAADAFGRELAAGWGTADRGGEWTVGGTTSVTGGAGQLVAAAGRNASALLAGVSQADVAVQARVTLPQTATGGGTYVSLAARRVGTSDHRVLLRYRGDGQAEVMLARYVDGVETILAGTVLPGGYAPGTSLTVRFETAGTGTTTLRTKLWATGTAEPAAWLVTATDATAALQRPGAVYLYEYVSGSATAPSTVRVDDLWVGPAGTAPPAG